MLFGLGGDAGRTDGATPLQGALVIAPMTPVVNLTTGQAPSPVQFTATVGGMPTGVAWGIDRGELGTISPSGVFTPTGTLGGTANITAVYGSQKVTTTITVNILTTQQGDPAWMAGPLDAGAGGYRGVGGDGPGAAPSMAQLTALGTTPGPDAGDPGVSILYPYDGTVWPQGLLAPLLQWNPGSHSFDSVYVHIKEKNYEYKGYFAANTTPFVNLPIPRGRCGPRRRSRTAASRSSSRSSSRRAPTPSARTPRRWTIAQATLQGTIYYNSYGTALVKNSDTNDHYGQQYGAGTLAITSGATAPVLVAGVNSADAGAGNRHGLPRLPHGGGQRQSLVTQASNGNASDYSNTVYVNLANDTTGGAGTSLATQEPRVPRALQGRQLLLSSSGGMRRRRHREPPVLGARGDSDPRRHGLAGQPSGRAARVLAGRKARVVQLLERHADQRHHDAHRRQQLARDPRLRRHERVLQSPRPLHAGRRHLGDVLVVLARTAPASSSSWSSRTPPAGPSPGRRTRASSGGSTSRPEAHRLDQLNGYSGGNVVPPEQRDRANTHTSAQDATLNYEPTVNPIASGGYAWVVFTSRRMYGNVAQLDPWTSDPRQLPMARPGHRQEAVGGGHRPRTRRRAPTRATRPSTCRPRSSTPATRAATGRSSRATPTAVAARPATSAAAATASRGADGGLVCSSQMPAVLGAVRQVHAGQRLLRLPAGHHVHQQRVQHLAAAGEVTREGDGFAQARGSELADRDPSRTRRGPSPSKRAASRTSRAP